MGKIKVIRRSIVGDITNPWEFRTVEGLPEKGESYGDKGLVIGIVDVTGDVVSGEDKDYNFYAICVWDGGANLIGDENRPDLVEYINYTDFEYVAIKK